MDMWIGHSKSETHDWQQGKVIAEKNKDWKELTASGKFGYGSFGATEEARYNFIIVKTWKQCVPAVLVSENILFVIF